MACPVSEGDSAPREPLAVPPEPLEIGWADLVTCLTGESDHEKAVFESAVYWPCRPGGKPEEHPVLPEKLPDTSLEGLGEYLIPDWPEAKTARTRTGALVASLVFHLVVILLLMGFAQLAPPEVDFELAAGSTFLEVDMVQIAKLGGGSEELAPDETPMPEEVSDEEAPPEPDLTQLTPAEPAPAPEIEPVPTLDLKPKEAPEEKPKEEAKPKKAAAEKAKPKTAKPKPPRAIGSPEAGGKAGTGPGNVLGSVHGNSAVGGGGAGGTKSGGKPGWTVARRPEPRYPEASRQNKEQGRVVLMVTVLSSGKIGSASIAQSSGHSRLDQAALSAAKGIVFKPGKGGAPSGTVTVRVPYEFKLRK